MKPEAPVPTSSVLGALCRVSCARKHSVLAVLGGFAPVPSLSWAGLADKLTLFRVRARAGLITPALTPAPVPVLFVSAPLRGQLCAEGLSERPCGRAWRDRRHPPRR